MESRSGSTESVQDIDVDALSVWLSDHVPAIGGLTGYAKFAGGQSNPTYRLDAGAHSYVLRRRPFGELLPSAHAVDREFRLISGLYPAGYPVPRPYALCMDDGIIGAGFYVMELVEGMTHWDGALPGHSPEQRTAIYHEMVDRLAALHNLDYEAAGLTDHGKPGNYFERQIGRWTKQYRLAQTDDLPEAEKLIIWLARTVPEQKRTTIVHGDYRIDNMIFDRDAPRIKAVLDWELSTLGDPMADLSYLMMNWETPPYGGAGVKGLAGPETGIPTMEELIERYCAATGQSGIGDLNWYFAFCQFRLMGIAQGIKKRVLDGNASNARAEESAAAVPTLARRAWNFAQLAGAI